MTSMDVAPNGLAGFVYREGNVSARYVEESSLGVLKTPVEISTNLQGFISKIIHSLYICYLIASNDQMSGPKCTFRIQSSWACA